MIGTITTKKIEKAKTDISELEEFIKFEIQKLENKAKLAAIYDNVKDKHLIYIDSIPSLEDFSESISISAGGIIHLLRSSLDNLVFELSNFHTDNNIRKPKNIQFPIVDTLPSNDLHGISEIGENQKKIIEKFQPYHGISGRSDSYFGTYIHQLSLLREYSNSDKHRTMIKISYDPNKFELFNSASKIIKAHTEYVISNPQEYFDNFQLPKMNVGDVVYEVKVNNLVLNTPEFAGYATANISIAEYGSLIHTLKRICKYVELVVHDLIASI